MDYNAETFYASPREYIEGRIRDLIAIADRTNPLIWRSWNSNVTCDSHVDFEAVGTPAYFAPGMFAGDYIRSGSDEEAAMEGLSLMNLGVFGWDTDTFELVKLEGQGFGTNETWWARFSKVPDSEVDEFIDTEL